MVHFIALELNGIRMPDETAKLGNAVRAMGDCYAYQKTAWLVESERSNDEICKLLQPMLRATDRVLVMRIHRDWVSANMPQEEVDWLSARNFHGANDHLQAAPAAFPRR